MKLKVTGVRDPLRFVPPRLNRIVLQSIRCLTPLYLKAALGLRFGQTENLERLIGEYQDFFSGTSKLVLVFRHVHVNDAQAIFYLLNTILPKSARREKIHFPIHPHAHFLYGRGVPVWGGKWLEWLFSHGGGIPVFHRKLDREALDVLRYHLLNGAYPIALAPEGQVTYHNGVVHPIEPGFAQIALWAHTDLRTHGFNHDVRVLPISQHYQYGRDGEKVLLDLLDRLRIETGILIKHDNHSTYTPVSILYKTGAALLKRIEDFYRVYYGIKEFSEENLAGSDEKECSRRRVERLVDTVLKMQEHRLGIHHPPRGFTPRIFVVRQAGWDRVFRERTGADGDMPLLEASLNEYLAVEAGLFARHLELVDLLAYLQPEYALESGDVNRHIEFALNLLDTVNRLKGGTIGQRYNVRPSEVTISIGTPLSLNDMNADSPGISPRQLRKLLVDEVSQQFTRMSY